MAIHSLGAGARARAHIHLLVSQLDFMLKGQKLESKKETLFTLKVCILINTLFRPCGKHMGSLNINAVYVY